MLQDPKWKVDNSEYTEQFDEYCEECGFLLDDNGICQDCLYDLYDEVDGDDE